MWKFIGVVDFEGNIFKKQSDIVLGVGVLNESFILGFFFGDFLRDFGFIFEFDDIDVDDLEMNNISVFDNGLEGIFKLRMCCFLGGILQYRMVIFSEDEWGFV